MEWFVLFERHLNIDVNNGKPNNLLKDFYILLHSFADIFGNGQLLRHFLEFILKVENKDGKPYSIWSDYIYKACQSDGRLLDLSKKAIIILMKCVAKEFGQNGTIDQMLDHNPGFMSKNRDQRKTIINLALCSGKIQIIEALLSGFGQRKRSYKREMLFTDSVIENIWNNARAEVLMKTYLPTFIENEWSSKIRNELVAGIFVLNHFLPKFNENELNELVLWMTDVGKRSDCSIWGALFTNLLRGLPLFCRQEHFVNEIRIFLSHCNKKIEKGNVYRLGLHEDAQGKLHDRVLGARAIQENVRRDLTEILQSFLNTNLGRENPSELNYFRIGRWSFSLQHIVYLLYCLLYFFTVIFGFFYIKAWYAKMK